MASHAGEDDSVSGNEHFATATETETDHNMADL